MYRFFDLCIESELELPGLAECTTTPPDWTVCLLDAAVEEDEPAWFHTWKTPGGESVMAVAREGERYTLGFFGLARFSIDFTGRRITAQAAAGCANDTLAHFLLDQVLPRTVCHEGCMVVHASAVQLADGCAIAFTGVSGRGKSTLAAAFHRAGQRLLSDDCLLLQRRAGAVYAVPAYASLRLWPDSADSLFVGEEQQRLQATRMAHYTNKRNLRPAERLAAAPVPLKALFLLEPGGQEDADNGGGVQLTETGGMAAIMTLVEAQFALDVVDREAIRRGFAAVRQVTGHVPVLRLAYPRDYRRLPEVIEKILNCLPIKPLIT